MHVTDRKLSAFRRVGVLLAALAVAACGSNLDSAMWECQLEVQKGNAGKSAEAAAERGRDITACMASRGHTLNSAKSGCQEGSVSSGCYLAGPAGSR